MELNRLKYISNTFFKIITTLMHKKILKSITNLTVIRIH